MTASNFVAEFNAALDKEITATAVPKDEWLAAGYRPRQDEEYWRMQGPVMCQRFADWYMSQTAIRVWTAPDGRPAIELDMTVQFGSVPVKMAPDLILTAGTALVIVDLKTGAQPANRRQLGIYACGVEKKYGIRPKYGTYFLAKGVTQKDGSTSYFMPPVELSAKKYGIEYLTNQFEIFDRAVRGGVFLANPGRQCATCSVADACPESWPT